MNRRTRQRATAKGINAVVIVDVQRAFDVPPVFVDRLLVYVRRFHCRVFTRFVNPRGSLFRRVLGQKCCAPGSRDTELLLRPEEGDLVFDKSRYGLSPKQVRELHRRGINRVTVCGLDTDACVLGIVFSLFDAGIECQVKEKFCWSSTGLHREAIRIIRKQFRNTK